jgi:hypothetical protein
MRAIAISTILFAALSASTAGCVFFTDDNDHIKEPPCLDGVRAPTDSIRLRNPDNGQCVDTGYTYCDSECGPCPEPGLGQGAAANWGKCESECTGLAEGVCLGTDGCFAAYVEDPAADGPPEFEGCWQVSPYGYSSGSCEGMSASACAERDDCSLYYVDIVQDGTYLSFNRCETESGGVTHDPGSCTGQVACDANPPACPSGTTPGIRNSCWSGYCIPNTACGPNDPGQCYGPLTCLSVGPACPTGTTPGIANGCYTGYCIPTGNCGAAACSSLTTEGACTARGDCNPVYEGSNCTCNANGCSCQTVTFDHCESL